jgi:1-acyl-sn-glycerol-3-phosphate acyltransferase
MALYLDAVAILLPNTRICITGDSDIPVGVGTSIMVANNHATNVSNDWLTAMMMTRCIGLQGSVKIFLQESVRSIPFFGLILSLMEFPFLGEKWVDYRQELFQLLRSFADEPNPILFLLFPSGGSAMNEENLAKSIEFAKREGRPQLKHLLLPRTTGFNACLDSLRNSSPVVYDMTLAYKGYDGSINQMGGNSDGASLTPETTAGWKAWGSSFWALVKGKGPSEVHMRIKRYSMEEVLADGEWLDKQWADKDRMLSHFCRHQQFPTDGRGFCRQRTFETKTHNIEASVMSLARLCAIPLSLPLLIIISIPLATFTLYVWVSYRFIVFLAEMATDASLKGRHQQSRHGSFSSGIGSAISRSAGGVFTPYFPATPFASPLAGMRAGMQAMYAGNSHSNGGRGPIDTPVSPPSDSEGEGVGMGQVSNGARLNGSANGKR